MPSENFDPAENLILGALPSGELRQILSHARCVTLEDKELLYEQEAPIEAVYFPLTGAVSMLTRMGDG
ncbi:MAG TPA: cyclic nucleotide-binding domain-containing protein, partial [Nitrospiraceae bacterium]|nr:cyclic nucleotide-binding domain-containing protein [Nitrospiraceae bacterium]